MSTTYEIICEPRQVNGYSNRKEKKRLKEKEQDLNHLWDGIEQSNIHVTRVPEGEERDNKVEKVFEEILAGKFSNLIKTSNLNKPQIV